MAKAELPIRTVLSTPATEAEIAMNLTKRTSTRFPEKLDFAAGDKICSQDGHLKVSRGEISLVNLVVQLVDRSTTSCLLTLHSLCHVNVRAAWNGYLGFSFSFPGYLEWQRPFRAKLRVKKSLWKEILLILLSEFVGVQREFKGRLKNDCNTLMNLSFQFPCYSSLELSLMLQFTFLCLSFSISF